MWLVCSYAMLFTFGLAVPLLGAVIVCSIISTTMYLQIIVGRYVCIESSYLKNISSSKKSRKFLGLLGKCEDEAKKELIESEHKKSLFRLNLLNRACVEVRGNPIKQARFVLQIISSVFLSFFLWDTLSDEVGWYNAIWV